MKLPVFYFELILVTEYQYSSLTSHPNEPNSCSRKIKTRISKIVLRTTDLSLEKTGVPELRIK